MTIEFKNTIGILSDINFAKLPYTTPVLLVFGQVAALTRAQSGCGMSDASNCITGGGNMGVMM